MDLLRYDVIKAKIKYQGEGSVQTKERPYVIVSNPIGTKRATIITVMPLTSKIKKTNMPVGTIISKEDRRMIDQTCFNGLFFGTGYRLEEARA